MTSGTGDRKLSYDQLFTGLESGDDRQNFGLVVGEMLFGLDTASYIPLFREANIGLDLFLQLEEEDLIVLGIKDANDRAVIADHIKTLSTNKNSKSNQPITRQILLDSVAEPKISMRHILLMQCHTIKQLKYINGIMRNIELKLKRNEFQNTLLDNHHCAAHALMLISSEIARQADMLCSEFKNLNDALAKIPKRRQPNKPKTQKEHGAHGTLIYTGLFLAATVPFAVILWRYSKK